MRVILSVCCLALLAGCASPNQTRHAGTRSDKSTEPKAILDNIRLTLDIRYPLGETLSLETRVSMVCGPNPVSTRLAACGSTPTNDYTRFTTGGIMHPGLPIHVLVTPPAEPTQAFEVNTTNQTKRLGTWSDWQKPGFQFRSPAPAQALIHQQEIREKLTVPTNRLFEIRYQFTAYNARDPKEN